jgi:hypothetical protein
MNGRQALALRFHCRLGIETVHPKFIVDRGDYSVVLTVNSGYE